MFSARLQDIFEHVWETCYQFKHIKYIKGTVCSFGEDILITWEKSLGLNKLNKQTVVVFTTE